MKYPRAASQRVVEMLDAVADRHDAGLVPLDTPLSADDRCQIIRDDFFVLARSGPGFDADNRGRQFHAILIDIDHTPDWLLDARSGGFYSEVRLQQLMTHLKPGSLLRLWSDVTAKK
jgi:hypothetical protein